VPRNAFKPNNMRMHLPKPRAPWSKAGRCGHASFQVIRGRQVDIREARIVRR
jgi:predicted PilT family ATPase